MNVIVIVHLVNDNDNRVYIAMVTEHLDDDYSEVSRRVSSTVLAASEVLQGMMWWLIPMLELAYSEIISRLRPV